MSIATNKQLVTAACKLDIASKTYGSFYYGHLSKEAQSIIEDWSQNGILEHMADDLDIVDLAYALPHFHKELVDELFKWLEESFHG